MPCHAIAALPPILGSWSCLYNTNSAEARTSTLHHHHRAPASSKLLTPSPLQAVSPSISTRRCALQLVREIAALFCPSLCCSLVLCSSGRPQLPKRRVESNSLFRGFDSPLALFWVPSLLPLTEGWLAGCSPLRSLSLSLSQSYVVYLGGHAHGRAGAALASNRARARSSHRALLGSVLRSEARARDAIFYSYTRYINGFAATLEEDEAAEVSSTCVWASWLMSPMSLLLPSSPS